MARVLKLVGWRIVTAALTILGVSIMIFAAIEILPGDVATRVLGRQSTEQQREVFREKVGLNIPAPIRYIRWLGGIAHGDLGRAYTSDTPVIDLIRPRLRNTLMLSGLALLLYFPVTGLFATLAALARGSKLDNAIQGLTLIGLSLPEFVQGTLLMLVFSVAIPLFPVMSQVELARSSGELLSMMVLPALVLTSAMSMYAIRMLRDNLIEVFDSTYIRTARLKGLSRWRVAFFHALPNALLPALNITALNLTWLIGGVVIIERVFAFPGFGSLLVDSISYHDIPLIEATVLIATVVYVGANMITDILSILLTPKLRTG
jgi:peptide/nickel transport system permease protein